MNAAKRRIIYAVAAVAAIGAGAVTIINEISNETLDGSDFVAAGQYAIAAFVSLLAHANVKDV
jgi:hypothetical protein